MKRAVNYKMGAQKRKYNLGRGQVEPGTFISKSRSQKATMKEVKQLPSKTKVAILGMI